MTAAAAEYRGIRHIFVDNITFLLNDSEKGEADHLRQKNAFTEAEDLQELIDLQAQNKTVREIAAEWNKRNRQETNRSCAITGETWLIFLVFRPL